MTPSITWAQQDRHSKTATQNLSKVLNIKSIPTLQHVNTHGSLKTMKAVLKFVWKY